MGKGQGRKTGPLTMALLLVAWAVDYLRIKPSTVYALSGFAKKSLRRGPPRAARRADAKAVQAAVRARLEQEDATSAARPSTSKIRRRLGKVSGVPDPT